MIYRKCCSAIVQWQAKHFRRRDTASFSFHWFVFLAPGVAGKWDYLPVRKDILITVGYERYLAAMWRPDVIHLWTLWRHSGVDVQMREAGFFNSPLLGLPLICQVADDGPTLNQLNQIEKTLWVSIQARAQKFLKRGSNFGLLGYFQKKLIWHPVKYRLNNDIWRWVNGKRRLGSLGACPCDF